MRLHQFKVSVLNRKKFKAFNILMFFLKDFRLNGMSRNEMHFNESLVFLLLTYFKNDFFQNDFPSKK